MANVSTTPQGIAPPFPVALMFPDVEPAVLVAERLGDRGPDADRGPAWPAFLAQVLRPAPQRLRHRASR